MVRQGEDGPVRLEGLAIPFDSPSHVLFGAFREIIDSGVKINREEGMDVRALYAHKNEMILGREANDTLVLTRNTDGMHVSVTPPQGVGYAEETIRLVDEGYITGMSFGFLPVEWERRESIDDDQPDTMIVREMVLREVSFVGQPAYGMSSATVKRYIGELEEAEERYYEANPEDRPEPTPEQREADADLNTVEEGQEREEPSVEAMKAWSELEREMLEFELDLEESD